MQASLEFTPNNPTGYYKLDLADPAQREICLRLFELKNETDHRSNQLHQFYYSGSRSGGKRVEPKESATMERVWRNSRLNGVTFRFHADWKLPHCGILEVDFVQIIKPDTKDCPCPGNACTPDQTFFQMLSSLPGLTPQQQISVIRRYSNAALFTCQQLEKLLCLFDQPEMHVEVCVIGYARTIDWHCFKYVILTLEPRELKMFHHRIGFVNIFDDVMAVNFYELNLESNEDRFVMQELLHLASTETGNNMIDCTYQGIDFTVPAGWLKDVPKSGVISFYYCREQQVIEKIFTTGSWDKSGSPFHTREDGTVFGPSSWSNFAPEWLRPFCELKPKIGSLPSCEPHGTDWVMQHKMRRIQMKMMDKCNDPKRCFVFIDSDGGGSLCKKELAAGLFSLGIWLAPSDLQNLFTTMDRDGSGEIDFEEYQFFWDNFTFT